MLLSKTHYTWMLILFVCLMGNLMAAPPAWKQLIPSPSTRNFASMASNPLNGQLILFGGVSNNGILDDTWTWDGAAWVQLTPAASPPARYGASLVFDPSSGQFILFGGADHNGVFGDTWAWNGSNWVQLEPNDSPSPRTASLLAFDPSNNGQLILFGGQDFNAIPSDDTWAWNGSNWAQLTPDNSPSARVNASLALNPSNGQLILFGGFNSGGYLNDTWTWNGSNWILLTPDNVPSARVASVLAFDAANERLILFGGSNENGYLDDTWIWNDITWTQLTPANSPPPRDAASMAFDSLASRLILFGGQNSNGYLDDTWAWNGVTWAQPFTSPSPRYAASMAFDSLASQLILFGGQNSNGYLDETWIWNSTTWTQLTPTISPSARYGASMAFDAATDQLILFGGLDDNGLLNDTWIWNGSNWILLTPTTLPSARYAASLAFDVASDQLILFGGFDENGPLNDTWMWNGSNWILLTPTTLPPVRFESSMAFDAVNEQLILFGGLDNNGFLNDTWMWTGSDWVPLTPATLPPVRFEASLTFDAANGQLILFGGQGENGALNDTWTWNGSTWTQLTSATLPPTRSEASMAFDAANGQLILFGGRGENGILNDTWTWAVIPEAVVTPTSQTICSGETASITLSSDVPGTTFSWTVTQSGVTGGSTSSGSNIAQVLTVTGNIAGSATYTITPTSPQGYTGPSITATVAVNPLPMAMVTPTSQTICSRGITSLTLSSNVADTTFSWTVSQTGVTGGSNGSGSNIVQVLTATENTAGTATYTITPTSPSGCSGNPITATVKVNPLPMAMVTPTSQTICSGETTSLALSSNVADTTFSWTVSQTGVTGGSDGSGSNIVQVLTATENTAGTVTYTITPTSPSGCSGNPITATVTVNPIVVAVAKPTSQIIQSGQATSLKLSSNVAGTIFKWTVSQKGVKGGRNGSGATIAQVLTATGNTAGTATYIITPTSPSGCSGAPIKVTVRVNAASVTQATKTTLVSLPNPSLTGQLVTFTATIMTGLRANKAPLVPTGEVIFLENGAPIGKAKLNSNGQAILKLSVLSAGSHTIVARYMGNASFAPSSSAVLVQLVYPRLPISPASNFKSKLVKNEFATQTTYVNRLTWKASADSRVVSYRLLRNGKTIATLPANQISYSDPYPSSATYELIALDNSGATSFPLVLHVSGKR
jgi:hypothetical protein